MANTYSQIYIQIVFAVSGRENLIAKEWKAELYKYMTGIVTNHGQKIVGDKWCCGSRSHSFEY